MRVNVYAEEMTDRIEIISKTIDGQEFTGLRFYLELPVTDVGQGGVRHQIKGPFIHRDGDDDSSAVTFWGKRDLRVALNKALAMLDRHYGKCEVCPVCKDSKNGHPHTRDPKGEHHRVCNMCYLDRGGQP